MFSHDGMTPFQQKAATRLYSEAACSNEPAHLFDQTDPILAASALAVCFGCDVRTECLTVMQPQRSHYDGVVGGIIWSNGVPLEQKKIAPRTRKPEQ